MRTKIVGEENYAPEVFARAEQLVWHYGGADWSNPDRRKADELIDLWLSEYPDVEPEGMANKTRILILAHRSMYYNAHTCDETCVELPHSPWDKQHRSDGYYKCQHCFRPFDPISTRYLCPYQDCKMKNTCCE